MKGKMANQNIKNMRYTFKIQIYNFDIWYALRTKYWLRMDQAPSAYEAVG